MTLKAVNRQGSNDWWKNAVKQARTEMRERLDAGKVVGIPGTFLATVAQPKGELLATLPGIRWKEDRVVYLGPVTPLATTGEPQP